MVKMPVRKNVDLEVVQYLIADIDNPA